jgi:hypothetical protein
MKKLKDKVIYPAWEVAIVQNKVVFKQREAFDQHLIPLEGKENLVLTIKRKVKPRSRNVEEYYHAVVVRMIAAEMGVFDQEAHEMLKDLFLKEEKRGELPGGKEYRYKRTGSTTELGDAAYMEYVFRTVIPWAALPTKPEGLGPDSGLGLYIPLPNEADWDGKEEWEGGSY